MQSKSSASTRESVLGAVFFAVACGGSVTGSGDNLAGLLWLLLQSHRYNSVTTFTESAAWQDKIDMMTRYHAHHRIRLVLVAVGSLFLAGQLFAPTAHGEDYDTIRGRLDRQFSVQFDSLAAKCDDLQLPSQATSVRNWNIHRDPRRQYLYLPPVRDPLAPSEDAERIVQQWYAKFTSIRKEFAESLFQLARQEVETGYPTRAYQLLHEVLWQDPDHEQARKSLGFYRSEGQWRRPEGVIKTRLARVPSPSLGFEAGEYWIADSPHFAISTNHSEEAAQALAEQMEDLYAVWQQLFFHYWSNRASLARRMEGNVGISRTRKHHRIVLFRDRQDYLAALRSVEPQIELTVGYYLKDHNTSYFYAGEASAPGIWFHEVTHQLFAETGRTAPAVGEGANAWAIEGVAMYMESLQKITSGYLVGGVDADRLQFARYRLLTEDVYLPLEQLAALGRTALQQREDIRQLYTQAAGVTSFLMDYNGGQYRPALEEFVVQVYQGRDRRESLAAATGSPFSTLDSEYRDFLNVSDRDLMFLASMPWAKKLLFGRTDITDVGLGYLAGHQRLQWLDVGFTAVTDRGIASLGKLEGLQQLNLERTAVTDSVMALVAESRNLEVLDLSGTAVTDASCPQLAKLSNLKDLWLEGTSLSDAGLAQLTPLKRLSYINVNGTDVTQEGLARLKAAIPNLDIQ